MMRSTSSDGQGGYYFVPDDGGEVTGAYPDAWKYGIKASPMWGRCRLGQLLMTPAAHPPPPAAR
jgi:hypothetical protein